MSAYHNAVSDKLVVCSFPNRNYFQVYDKEDQLKWSFVSSEACLPQVLVDAIFSNSTYISVAQNFVLTPSNASNKQEFYALSYTEADALEYTNLEDFTIVHNLTTRFNNLLQGTANAKICNDVSVVYPNIHKQAIKDSLYFYITEGVLTIFVHVKGNLHLINRYKIESNDELFYYVMLVVEQLDLPIESLNFECLATSGEHEVYQSLFKNYLPKLELTKFQSNLSFAPEDGKLKSEFLQSSYFAQCVL